MSTELRKLTEAELCQQALDVQDACNLSGVVHAYSNAMSALWVLADEKKWGTSDINTHPVAILYADKCAHLTRTQSLGHSKVLDAYSAAHKIIEAAKVAA